jgi:hypothetical protein
VNDSENQHNKAVHRRKQPAKSIEQFALGRSRLDIEIVIATFKNYKSSGSDQIPAEVKYYCLRSVNSLIICGRGKI